MKGFIDNLIKEFSKFNIQQKVAAAILLISIPLCLGMGVSAVSANSGSEPVITPSPSPTTEATATPSPTPTPEPTPEPDTKVKLIPASIEEDLEVQIVDEKGELILDEKFTLQVKCPANGYSKKWTVDGDGFLRLPTIPSGNYIVSIEEKEGFIMPEEPVRIKVEKKVEYKEIDVSDQVVDSTQVNEREEDAAFDDVTVTEPVKPKDTVEYKDSDRKEKSVEVEITTYSYKPKADKNGRLYMADGVTLSEYAAEFNSDGTIKKLYKLTFETEAQAVSELPDPQAVNLSPLSLKGKSFFGTMLTTMSFNGNMPGIMLLTNEEGQPDRQTEGEGQTDPTTPPPPKCEICQGEHDKSAHKCEKCTSLDHDTANHPCETCGKTGHTKEDAHCSACGQYGHPDKSCVTPAYTCDYCTDPDTHNTADHPCDKNGCGGKGHTASMHECTLCSVYGHKTEACPNATTPTPGTSFDCQYCEGEDKHNTAEHPCDKNGCGGKGHTASMHECTLCSVYGHKTEDCPNATTPTPGASFDCKYCEGEDKHNTADHPCEKCGTKGHGSADHKGCDYCTEDHATKDHVCTKCNGKGHIASAHTTCDKCTSDKHTTDKHDRATSTPSAKPEPTPTKKTEVKGIFDEKTGKVNSEYEKIFATLKMETVTAKTKVTEKVTVYIGWQTIDGKKYYYDPKTNKPVTGEQTIQGMIYFFDDNGVLNTKRIGIDVSKYQKNIDWKKVKDAGIEFAIIRVGYRGYGTGKLVWDNYFEKNIKGATAAGIKVGVYIFSQAINTKEAVEEASMCLEGVSGYKITYPIFFDTEYSTSRKTGRADWLTKDQRTKIAQAFCETIRSAGYKPGVYASASWFNNQLSYSGVSSYEIWVAHYTSAGKPSFSNHYDMWQYTGSGTCAGVPGAVDMNIGYTYY